jgi:hypothetical protein
MKKLPKILFSVGIGLIFIALVSTIQITTVYHIKHIHLDIILMGFILIVIGFLIALYAPDK